ncbi:MAG TPA: hypothetical protein VGL11_24685 [Candidatus Binatia bacterium]|jgi:hypothetical protein
MTEDAEIRLNEKIFALFEPDALLPVQYFDLLRRKVPIEPEIRLMWAILEDAIDSYRKHHFPQRGKPNGRRDEVESWIFDRGNDWLYSFDNICETLGIDPQYLRGGLRRWKRQQLAAETAVKIAQAIAPKRKKSGRCVVEEDDYGSLRAAG